MFINKLIEVCLFPEPSLATLSRSSSVKLLLLRARDETFVAGGGRRKDHRARCDFSCDTRALYNVAAAAPDFSYEGAERTQGEKSISVIATIWLLRLYQCVLARHLFMHADSCFATILKESLGPFSEMGRNLFTQEAETLALRNVTVSVSCTTRYRGYHAIL